jgi:hypothetical protein
MKYKLVEVLKQDSDCTKNGRYYNILACNEVVSTDPKAKEGWQEFKTDEDAISSFGVTKI